MAIPVNRNLNQRIRQSLYSLKREYGAPIDIYKLVSTDTDVRTGMKTVVKTVTHIKRAPVLPARITRLVNQSISLISANKQLVMGGTYDSSKRDFIVDRRDAPNLTQLTADDWIVYDSRKWQIETIEEFEVRAGWIITAKELVGEVPEQIFTLMADHRLAIGQTATAEVE